MLRTTGGRLGGLRLLVVLAMAMAACGSWTAGALAAQDESSHEFEDGEVLEWGGRWNLEPEFTFIDGEIEMVSLSTGSANFHVITVPSGTSKNEIRDTFLDGFLGEVDDPVTIDRGDYGAVSYSLDLFSTEGVPFGGFMLIREGASGGDTFAYFVVAPIETMSETIADIQGKITLDGSGFFEGIDGQGLEDQLLSAADGGSVPDDESDDPSGDDEGDDPTPEATEEDDEEGSGNGGKFGGNKDDEETPEADEETPVAEETPEDDPDEPEGDTGLVEDGLYISPFWGSEITWDSNFIVNEEANNPVFLDEDAEVDGVSLIGTGSEFVTITITNYGNGDDGTLDGIVEYWSSDDYMEAVGLSSSAEILFSDVLETTGFVMFQDEFETDDGSVPILWAVEAHYDPETGNYTTIQILTPAGQGSVTFPQVSEGIAINGETPFENINVNNSEMPIDRRYALVA